MHPDYSSNSKNFDADISLVILTSAVLFTDQIQPICLPELNQIDSPGFVVSWKFDQNKSSKFFKTEENSATIDDCNLLPADFKYAVTDQTFCSTFSNKSQSFCYYDNGDGLYVEHSNKFYIRGITAKTLMGVNGKCETSGSVVYIRIASSWIHWEMSKSGKVQLRNFNCIKDIPESIQCMESKSFSNANINKFKIISTNIFDEAGEKFKFMTSFEVSETSLKSLSRRQLAQLTQLETFKFKMNQVELLREKVFWDLENLRELSLLGNGLKEVSVNHFIKLVRLVIIDLSSNKIEHLPRDLFEKNLKLESILLSGNPLKIISVDFTKFPSLSNLALVSSGCIDDEAKNQLDVIELTKELQKCAEESN